MHLPSPRLSDMQFLIIAKFRACSTGDVGIDFLLSRQKEPKWPCKLLDSISFCWYPLQQKGSVLARQIVLSFNLLALAAVSSAFFAITYEKKFIIKLEGEEGSNYGIDIENHFQAGLTIGMTAQHTILNIAFLSDSTLPGCAYNGVISLAGAAFSAEITGEPAFIQLSRKKSVEVYTIR